MVSTSILERSFDVGEYNALPSVEEADRAIEDRRSEFLDSSARLLKAHGLEKRFGVGLLHKHNSCDPGEHMIQHRERLDGEDALVTRPTLRRPGDEGAVPILWSTQSGDYLPLEYSTDPRAAALFGDGAVPADFLAEFAELKRGSPIGDYLGLAVVQRDFFDLVDEDAIAVEQSDPEARTNVVFARKRDEVKATLVQTAWSFENYIEPKLGCEATIECEKWCNQYCASEDGSHKQAHQDRHKPVTVVHL